MYTFARLQCHPKCPNLTEWYLRLDVKDTELSERIHRSVAVQAYTNQGMDPHLFAAAGKSKSEWSMLSALWLVGFTNQILDGEDFVYIGRAGSFFPNPSTAIVLEERQLEKLLDWPPIPSQEPDKYEYIRILQWGDGVHYYLSSSTHRIIVPEKFDTLGDAWSAAEKFVPKERITYTPRKPIKREGD